MGQQHLEASGFFDNDGLFAETNRLALRKPVKSDIPGFIEAFSAVSPGIAKWYLENDKALDLYWQSINDKQSLYCSICSKSDGNILGYCTIENLAITPFELGINLATKHHGQGIGTEAMVAFMQGFERIAGPSEFLAKITSRNARSQNMFRKLGFIPSGIATILPGDPEMIEKFEESQLDSIDATLCNLAEEFDVEPRRLLSHALVFKRPITS